MVTTNQKEIAANLFRQISSRTVFMEMTKPVQTFVLKDRGPDFGTAERGTHTRGEFPVSVHAQRFEAGPDVFYGDYWASYDVCFVLTGEVAGVPKAKQTRRPVIAAEDVTPEEET